MILITYHLSSIEVANMPKKSIAQKIQEHPIIIMIAIGFFASVVVIGTTANWDFVSANVFPSTTLGLYNKSFWENILVEAHGFLLDFIMFGVLVFGLDSRRISREKNQKAANRQQQEKDRMNEELSDFSALDMPEVNLKKIGNIKRLQRLGIEYFNVTQLTINGCNIKDLVFSSKSCLIGLQLQDGHMNNIKFDDVAMRSSFFTKSTIRSCRWNKCDLRRISLKDSKAKGSKFIECNMANADLRNADLTGVQFKNSSMENIKFDGAILNRADFRGAKNLNVFDLASAKSIDYIVIDMELLEKLKELRPDMKAPEFRPLGNRTPTPTA